MLVRPRQGLEVLSISALDLFASALGVFILITIALFPYYLRQPSVEVELKGAQAELTAAGRSLSEAERDAEAAERLKASAQAALAAARERLARAEAAAAAAAEEASRVEVQPVAVRTDRGSTGRRAAALSINDLDLVVAVDTTGSMRGELRDVQASLVGIVRVLHRLAPTLRIGFVAFKDHGDEYLTRAFPLSPMDDNTLRELLRFVRGLSAGGGGDDPEAVDEALHAAINMPWRADAQGQIIVIGDAPAHLPNWQRAFDLAAGFQRSAPAGAPPRTVSAVLTGQNPSSRTFFERVAAAGGGEFTEHQGRMIESVLVSVLREAREEEARR